MNELALFAGAGGGILGGKLLGWRTVCAVERDAYAAAVLAQRQNDGCLEPFPIWSDVETFDGAPWRGVVDVVSGGFPCQDISCAGKGAGIDGKRSGLWSEMARIIGEVRPKFVLLENSPRIIRRGLARVSGNLASMGYDARWGRIGADAAGFPHRRARFWMVAYSKRYNEQREPCVRPTGRVGREFKPMEKNTDWEKALSRVRRTNVGVAYNLDRTNAIRNGQVPAVVRLAWEILGPAELGI